MYGSDAGQPVPSLYTKGLSPLCDIYIRELVDSLCRALHKRVHMVKIWGSSKNDQNRITGKLLKLQKFIFTILHLLVVIVVVVVLLQFQLTYLKNRTELRNETLHTDRTP